jgi:hypothetical protein
LEKVEEIAKMEQRRKFVLTRVEEIEIRNRDECLFWKRTKCLRSGDLERVEATVGKNIKKIPDLTLLQLDIFRYPNSLTNFLFGTLLSAESLLSSFF